MSMSPLRQHGRPRHQEQSVVYILLDCASSSSPSLWVSANAIALQPIIPLSISGYTDVACRICNFHQPLENRPDVKAMANGGGPPQGQHYGPPQGQPHGQQPMRYG